MSYSSTGGSGRPRSSSGVRRQNSAGSSNFNFKNYSNGATQNIHLQINPSDAAKNNITYSKSPSQPNLNNNNGGSSNDYWSSSYKLHYGYTADNTIPMGVSPNLINSNSANNIKNPSTTPVVNTTRPGSNQNQQRSYMSPTASSAIGTKTNTEKFPPVSLAQAIQQQNNQGQKISGPPSPRITQAERIRNVIASNRLANTTAGAKFKEELSAEQKLQSQYEKQLSLGKLPISTTTAATADTNSNNNNNTNNNKASTTSVPQIQAQTQPQPQNQPILTQTQPQQPAVVRLPNSMGKGVTVTTANNTNSNGSATSVGVFGNTTYFTINGTDADDSDNKSVGSMGVVPVGTGAVNMSGAITGGTDGVIIQEGPVASGGLADEDDEEMDGKPINNINVSQSRTHPEVSSTSLASYSEGPAANSSSVLDGRNNSMDSFQDEFIDLGISTIPNQFCTVRDAIDLKKMLLLTHGVRGGMVPSATSVMDMYMVGKVIGVGSYGKVRAAWHRLTGSKVAIKTYDKSKMKDESHWKRVHSEIKIMEQVSHPRIARMYEAIETPKRMHLIMECLEGGNLCSYVKAKKRLTEDDAKGIFFQLIQAIDYVHNLSVTHRDIKLENILFSSSKETCRDIKIIDFGFSTVCQPGKKLKVFCGTPSYMAPEIVKRTEYEGKPVDMWSLGILLYALLCGCFPFRAKSYPDLYRRIARGTFQIPDDIGSSVRDLINQLLDVDATRRITSSAVLRHPWLQTAMYASPDMKKLRNDIHFLISERPSDDLDEMVLNDLEKFGMPREEIVRLVLSKLHSSLTTFYYLLLDISLRKRKKIPLSNNNTRTVNPTTAIPMEKLGYSINNGNNNNNSSGNTSSRSSKSTGAVPNRSSQPITATVTFTTTTTTTSNGTTSSNNQTTVNSLREKNNNNNNTSAAVASVNAMNNYNYIQQVQQSQSNRQRSSSFNATNAHIPPTIIMTNTTVTNASSANNNNAVNVRLGMTNGTNMNPNGINVNANLQRPLSASAGRRGN